MQFRNFAENLLGSRAKIKVLKYLASEETITSEREIARLIGISPGAANKTLKEFQNLNLISPMKVGNATVWRMNEKSYAYSYLTDFFNKLKNKETPLSDLIEDIKRGLQKVKITLSEDSKKVSSRYLSGIKKVILFGSVAEGRELPESDIDLFIQMESEKDRMNVIWTLDNGLNITCLRRYGNKLNSHIFTSVDMKNPKHKKFLENVMKGIRVIER
ncbi:MAG: nucleotidyltransferase domain-containing protein [Candidatus Aenigmatarchaeota archaeon]